MPQDGNEHPNSGGGDQAMSEPVAEIVKSILLRCDDLFDLAQTPDGAAVLADEVAATVAHARETGRLALALFQMSRDTAMRLAAWLLFFEGHGRLDNGCLRSLVEDRCAPLEGRFCEHPICRTDRGGGLRGS